MESTKQYQVECLECSATRVIRIHKTPVGGRIDWMDDKLDESIVSGRERLDNQFGWQCLCGNNDLMTEQEHKTFTNKAQPKPQEINEIVKDLIVSKPKFNLVEA